MINYLLNELNLTVGSVIIMLAAMFAVEAGRIIARARSADAIKFPFSWKVWAQDWTNWLSVLVAFTTGIVCISIREGIAEFGGLVIANKERFDLFFAAVVGSGWQGIWKVVLTAGESLAVNKR